MYLIDLGAADSEGFVQKVAYIDLLDIKVIILTLFYLKRWQKAFDSFPPIVISSPKLDVRVDNISTLPRTKV